VFHYCSKVQAGKARVDPMSILRSIVRQMAWVPETMSIASPINQVYTRLQLNRPIEGNLSSRDCECLIKEILHEAQILHGAAFRVVIDALDECEEPEKLLKSLLRATESCENVYFMLSSRPNVRIHAYVPSAVPIDIDPAKSLEDMKFFVSNEIDHRDEKLLEGAAPEMEEQLCALLLGNANGM
jgi:hypothetical protein